MLKSPPRLWGAEAKLIRAEENLHALDAEIEAFLRDDPYHAEFEFHPESPEHGEFALRLFIDKVPPVRIGVLVGDVAHNIRSALDYLVYELTLLRSGQEIDMTQFPMYGDVYEYRRYRRSKQGRWLNALTTRDRAFIQEAQPYREPGLGILHPLAQLALISNQDKHRVLHTAITMVSSLGIKLTVKRDITALGPVRAIGGPIEDGAPIALVKAFTDGPSPEVEMESELTLNIGFDNGLFVLKSMEEIRVFANHIFDQLAPLFV